MTQKFPEVTVLFPAKKKREEERSAHTFSMDLDTENKADWEAGSG
jgi:hypothetical protein